MEKSTIDNKEIEKFSKLSSKWWDEKGEFSTLHQINPIRLSYIKDKIIENFGDFHQGLKIVDIGCGGGIISEPLSRMGADVTGIDASEENIKSASLHAKEQNLDINYICSSAENHNEKYDVVLCLEIIEHVSDPEIFIKAVTRLMKPEGILIVSTINRTTLSYLQTIIAAEYILSLVPKGTHEFSKFLKPSEIAKMLAKCDLHIKESMGLGIDLITRNWKLTNDLSVNYFLIAKKS